MSYLKEIFFRSIEIVERVDNVSPLRFRYTVGILHFGEIKDIEELFVVSIKTSDGELGWLYSDSGAMTFSYKGEHFAVRLNALRERVEQILGYKVFITDPSDARHGVMYRDGKRIDGYINFEEIYKLRAPLW
jgi:hypothetical protein